MCSVGDIEIELRSIRYLAFESVGSSIDGHDKAWRRQDYSGVCRDDSIKSKLLLIAENIGKNTRDMYFFLDISFVRYSETDDIFVIHLGQILKTNFRYSA